MIKMRETVLVLLSLRSVDACVFFIIRDKGKSTNWPREDYR